MWEVCNSDKKGNGDYDQLVYAHHLSITVLVLKLIHEWQTPSSYQGFKCRVDNIQFWIYIASHQYLHQDFIVHVTSTYHP